MFSKDCSRVCAHCEFGIIMQGGEHILCHHKGIVTSNFACKKFVYDPLKRIPKRRKPLKVEYEKSDFSLT